MTFNPETWKPQRCKKPKHSQLLQLVGGNWFLHISTSAESTKTNQHYSHLRVLCLCPHQLRSSSQQQGQANAVVNTLHYSPPSHCSGCVLRIDRSGGEHEHELSSGGGGVAQLPRGDWLMLHDDSQGHYMTVKLINAHPQRGNSHSDMPTQPTSRPSDKTPIWWMRSHIFPPRSVFRPSESFFNHAPSKAERKRQMA